jgi:hypothetical protein
MARLAVVSFGAHSASEAHVSGNVLLILAALLLFVSIQLLKQALMPIREVVRALAAAAGVAFLVFLAFALVVGSLIVPR